MSRNLSISFILCIFKILFRAKTSFSTPYFRALIIGFLQPYEQKFVDILILSSVKIFLKDVSSLKSLIFYRFPMLYSLKFSLIIFVHNNWIFATLWAEICRYLDDMFCKNIFEGCLILKIFDFLPFSVLKLHFQHLIFAEIWYNEFLSMIIGFSQLYE